MSELIPFEGFTWQRDEDCGACSFTDITVLLFVIVVTFTVTDFTRLGHWLHTTICLTLGPRFVPGIVISVNFINRDTFEFGLSLKDRTEVDSFLTSEDSPDFHPTVFVVDDCSFFQPFTVFVSEDVHCGYILTDVWQMSRGY
jgi:hypothetical protein